MDIANHLEALESEFLTNATRKNAERVGSLLAESFREFGSSGRVYSKDDIISTLQDEVPVFISLSDYEMTLLSAGVALVTFQSHKEQQNGPPIVPLRSSIWIQDNDCWRMIFHQGTKLPS